MMPRFITDIEKEYNSRFPSNPATWFFIERSREKQDRFIAMLRHAIATDTPLSKDDILTLWTKEAYDEYVAYIEEWVEINVQWDKSSRE